MADALEVGFRRICFSRTSVHEQFLGNFFGVARPLQGESPTIDLIMGYNKANSTPLLKQFLSRADEIVEHVSQKENLLSAKKGKSVRLKS